MLWKESKLKALKKFLSFLREIKNEKIDIAFDLSLGYQYSLFFKLIGIPDRIGFNYKNRGRFLTKKMDFSGFKDKPIAEYYLELAMMAGLEIMNFSTNIWLGKEDETFANNFLKSIRHDRDIVFGISPGGGVSFGTEKIGFKRWDSEHFAELADKLIDNLNSEVIFIWGPGEEELIRKIVSLMKNKPRIAPHTTLAQMAALMKKCDMVICNDSGPLHVATAAGAKTISIFGPSDEKVYGPYPPDKKHLVVTKDLDCRPCYKKFRLPNCENRACLKELKGKDVFSAIIKGAIS